MGAAGRVAVARSRPEGRGAGVATVNGEDTVVGSGLLPVDGAQTLVKLLGAGELPLAEDSPHDSNTSQRGSHSDESCQSFALAFVVLGGSRERGCGSINSSAIISRG